MQPRAAEAARTTERSYQLGESTLLEVIDARRTFLEARTECIAALVQAQADCRRLAIFVEQRLP